MTLSPSADPERSVATAGRPGWVPERLGVESPPLAAGADQGLPRAGSLGTERRIPQRPLDGAREPAGVDRGVRPLRTRLEEARRQAGAPWDALERDCLPSRMLAGRGEAPALRGTLVFRGGTTLRQRAPYRGR